MLEQMTRLMLVQFLLTGCVTVGSAAQRRLEPVAVRESSSMNRIYSEVAPAVLPMEIGGIGVSFRHFLALLPGQPVPEVAFVVERDILDFQKFGRAHAIFIEPVDASVWDQISQMPADFNAEQVKSHLRMSRRDFTEDTCPAIVEILATAQASQQKIGSWSGQVWHPVHIEARIKTSASNVAFDCTGECFGIEQWSVPAYYALKACADRTAPPN